MNFSAISNKSLLGRALRQPLKLLPSRAVMPVIQGRMKGMRWVVGSGDHGYWLGSYEYHKQKLFERILKPKSVVLDLGGNVGFYTLLSSVLVGLEGRIFVFEPLQRNLKFLYQHLHLNHITNVTVIEAAVSDTCGQMSFNEDNRPSMGHLSTHGDTSVEVVSLDTLFERGELPKPDFIKIDIEGAEYDALTGAESLLKASQPTIFLATHGKTVHQKCLDFLDSLGYRFEAVNADSIDQTDEILAYCDHST